MRTQSSSQQVSLLKSDDMYSVSSHVIITLAYEINFHHLSYSKTVIHFIDENFKALPCTLREMANAFGVHPRC